MSSKFYIPDKVIYLCMGGKCSKKGGKECYKMLKSYLKYSEKKHNIELIKVECTDRCDFAPVLSFQPDNVWLMEYREKEVLRLIDNPEHL